MTRMVNRAPSNWGLAPKFGADDLLFDDSAIQKPRQVSATARAAALGVPVPMLSAQYTDQQVENLSPKVWDDYKKVLRSRGQSSQIKRLSDLRFWAAEKRKCPGTWNPKTGCRPRKWYHKARDTGRKAVQDIARSPITQAALGAAAFTPLAPIAVPVGVGLATADRLVSGQGLDVGGLSELAAAAVGVPPGAVPVAGQLGKLASGRLDAEGLSRVAAQAVGVPPGAVRVTAAIARGDTGALSREAAQVLGVPPGAVPVATRLARGDLRGAASAGSRFIPVPSQATTAARGLKQLQSTAKQARSRVAKLRRDTLRASRGPAVIPSPHPVSSLFRRYR